MMRDGAVLLEQALRAARNDNRLALAAFLTAGYPTPDGFAELARTVGGVADVIEIGVPFSDPMADGVTIQRASRAALERGVTLRWILETLRGMDEKPRAPLVLMGYLNPFLAYGIDRLARDAAGAGVSGLIVPDLPLEESAAMRGALEEQGLALVQLVSPVTPLERLEKLCRASRGFVYAATVTGTTGGDAGFSSGVAEYLDRVRGVSTLPVLAGFGIHRAEQVRELAAHVDGVIVGSALIDALDRGKDPAAFLRQLMGNGRK
jgi:tryptophan synthase alpha chain